jgi:queuine tRNA-ribosyltransferase
VGIILSGMAFSFQLLETKNRARVGLMTTPHGVVETPIFMPVGTQATVKSLDATDIEGAGVQIILANTYHLYLRPGEKLLQKFGGIQPFMRWSKPMLTDSGGFQVFSLGAKITDNGVDFRSHLDGSKHFFTPEKSIEIQRNIGADVIMTFDECAPDSADRAYMENSVERTHVWAKRCHEYWQTNQKLSQYGNYQAMFGIIQGGLFEDLRQNSAKFISGIESDLNFDGIAVGGETVGYDMRGTRQVMEWIEPILPKSKPRYAMGLGSDPQDLVEAVALGFDMFDCVAPTRLARNGALYFGQLEPEGEWIKFVSPHPKGRLPIGNSQFKSDDQVIQPGCDCQTCQTGYSRAYLHHLYHAKELSYYRLATVHNVRFMIRLSQQIRKFILA